MIKTKHLDCTLRDGGYHNLWDFEITLVKDYLEAMSMAGIDAIEFGFRGLDQKQFYGAHAFTTDIYLENFEIPKKLKLGVMLNASDLIKKRNGKNHIIHDLFKNKKNSKISFVRIACHFGEYGEILREVDGLVELGYSVGLNLMQVAGRSKKDIEQFVEDASKMPISMLYFADSTGSLKPYEVKSLIKLVKSQYSGAIGVHMHDNMGFAVQNTAEAIKEGVDFVDSTVTGMGRGPGNAQTEYLVSRKLLEEESLINPVPLLNLIKKYFHPMQQRYKWGTNFFYQLTGLFQIHPTYIQEMLDDDRYGADEILEAINFLRKDGKKYSEKILQKALKVDFGSGKGNWDPSKTIRGREVLIVGSGDSVKKYKTAIEDFVLSRKPFVIALNTENTLDNSLIDLRVACNGKRIITDFSSYDKFTQPIVLPFDSLDTSLKENFDLSNYLNYGVRLSSGKFDFSTNFANLPYPLGIAYALAIANSGKAKKILVSGIDGYAMGDERNYELENLFKLYQDNKKCVDVFAITPTLFNLSVKSVYSF